ncbi:helix-turn-helix transcriptional regulator [Nocardia otitidiscaviarum]|uniref:winged helix-turn-helix transcriptional regulator n=1 Tax=Nocardia otitidiscaviarum TaxID=1823 RepID=UPI0004A6E564|nr:helix-turn-helix domain-containing protein [Nocardia otitidiscaviarum]MBF6131509.1 helix-turn-helix transcriptional regulator [Nocardia otitidiscaviarum]MBF6482655.1 helix-turn-helix transcriptional regulator [Nocardia otitidiscaviarum]
MGQRSYGQYCGLARALDVVGARWSLLIVRELLVGPARYNELLSGLPGIATNLLASRLRELEEVGVVARTLDTESNGVAYTLTPWGRELRDTVAALVKWSTPLMVSGPGDDTFREHWLVVALDALLRDRRTDEPTTIGFAVDDETVIVHVDETGARVERSRGDEPHTLLRGDSAVVLGLASGMLTVEQAVAAGALRGREADLRTVFGGR